MTHNPADAMTRISPSNCCPHCHRTAIVVDEVKDEYFLYRCVNCSGRWKLGYEVVMSVRIIKCEDDDCFCADY
jgi:hypothetical protein